jgi:hypothetical protein
VTASSVIETNLLAAWCPLSWFWPIVDQHDGLWHCPDQSHCSSLRCSSDFITSGLIQTKNRRDVMPQNDSDQSLCDTIHVGKVQTNPKCTPWREPLPPWIEVAASRTDSNKAALKNPIPETSHHIPCSQPAPSHPITAKARGKKFRQFAYRCMKVAARRSLYAASLPRAATDNPRENSQLFVSWLASVWSPVVGLLRGSLFSLCVTIH